MCAVYIYIYIYMYMCVCVCMHAYYFFISLAPMNRRILALQRLCSVAPVTHSIDRSALFISLRSPSPLFLLLPPICSLWVIPSSHSIFFVITPHVHSPYCYSHHSLFFFYYDLVTVIPHCNQSNLQTEREKKKLGVSVTFLFFFFFFFFFFPSNVDPRLHCSTIAPVAEV